jgi:hypothetical protein
MTCEECGRTISADDPEASEWWHGYLCPECLLFMDMAALVMLGHADQVIPDDPGPLDEEGAQ